MTKLITNTLILTIQEVFQSRVYQFLLVASILTPVIAYTLSSLFMVDVGKVYMDGALSVLHFVSIVFVLFIVSFILARDIEHKVCYLLVVQPANRVVYLQGRFFGFIVAYYGMFFSLVTVSIVFAEVLYDGKNPFYLAGYTSLNLFTLLLLHSLQYIGLLGFVFFIASWATGLVEVMFFTLIGFAVSWVLPSILSVINPSLGSDQSSSFLYNTLQMIYQALPHLNAADVSLMLTHGNKLPMDDIFFYSLEHISYAGVFFCLAVWFFRRRNL